MMKESHIQRMLAFAVLVPAAALAVHADDWPQWGGPQRDGVWREAGIVETFPSNGLPVRWRTQIGQGYSGPAVAAGRVYVMDRVVASPAGGTNAALRNETRGVERVLCLDEKTGAIIWTQAYDCTYAIAYGIGPRATPTVHGGKVYTVGAMGDFLCLDSSSGRVLWRKNFLREYHAKTPTWGFAHQPLVDGDLVITFVGGTGQTVVAFNRLTGAEVWKAGDAAQPGYSAPMIYTICGRRQLVAWHPEGLTGHEPATGAILWSVPFPAKSGMSITTPVLSGNRLAVSSQFGGATMIEFSPNNVAPKVLWHASANGNAPEKPFMHAGLNTPMSTLIFREGHLYGVSTYGETCCLDADTGERVWTTLAMTSGGDVPKDRWFSVFMTLHGDRVFVFSESGDLIIARFSPKGYEEIGRTQVIEPDMFSGGTSGRKVVWSPPAYANRCIYVRNNHEMICLSLAAAEQGRR